MTALLAEVDLSTGTARLVNAGHVVPLLVRGGRVVDLALAPGLVLVAVRDEATVMVLDCYGPTPHALDAA